MPTGSVIRLDRSPVTDENLAGSGRTLTRLRDSAGFAPDFPSHASYSLFRQTTSISASSQACPSIPARA